MRKKKTYEWPEGTQAGSLVRYYRDGWRIGHILDVDKDGAKIKPIGAIGASPNTIHVPTADVEWV